MSVSSILALILRWIPKATLLSAVAKVIKDYLLPRLTPEMADILTELVKEIFLAAPDVAAAATAAVESTKE